MAGNEQKAQDLQACGHESEEADAMWKNVYESLENHTEGGKKLTPKGCTLVVSLM